ncbi:hypothetical protein ACWDV4_13580 [Micromonospora sp. NPDC003197]
MSDPGVPDNTEDLPVGESDDVEVAAEFQNRAARRARGKGGAQAQTTGKGKHLGGGRGSVQGPRQWGNRRSG